ncbi:MAG: cell division protein FtsQ/DivIB [Pseudomonadota bacterium]|jgi:cell division protein FtsQ|uniref:cell division protein FtsQ/DivIB n=1 Tax=Alteromonas sp. 009811495 TaxID=3002962 RepID=UPI00237E9A7D|nr:cell division protein FtsQ/DivIB [Alteromonas sp. 009811495]WDT85192.1 cell division protein FtsQ/DivIB [Alteromonas sp. 009811495]
MTEPNTKQGAANLAAPKKSKRAMWGGVAFLGLVLAGLVFGGMKANQYLYDEQQMPVQVIDFSGDYQHIDIAKLERLIRKAQPGSFFALDVNEVFELVESQSWVYRASVRKKWPNTLKIYLVEQQPVAKWNEDLLLNPYGDTFNDEGVELQLPRLYGPGGSEKTALEGYNAMHALITTTDMAIDELSLSERFAWQVQLKNGIKLNLGRQEFIDRLQRFIDVYPLLAQQEKAVKYVDLRYDTGVAVGWNDDNTTDEES